MRCRLKTRGRSVKEQESLEGTRTRLSNCCPLLSSLVNPMGPLPPYHQASHLVPCPLTLLNARSTPSYCRHPSFFSMGAWQLGQRLEMSLARCLLWASTLMPS